ncbi:4Fe-4S binding protein [Acidaminobacter sp. JC074]|uniref:4Fe-4S binding protein n=1 Tax=Acidaminobacter sp. JC074 TaxID=2530199 RepID=UPI001F0F628C|nr:4Fe-4S binding protein [Acidaminobacter sp. JC074]
MMYLNDVVTIKLDSSKCVKCGECVQVCPREVFKLSSELQIVKKDACIECGACQMNFRQKP